MRYETARGARKVTVNVEGVAMKGSRRSPMQVVRELSMAPDERRAGRAEREAEQRMRSERDSTRQAERLAARTAAEARRHSNQHGV